MKKAILALLVLASAQSFAASMMPRNLVAKENIAILANSTSTMVLYVEGNRTTTNNDSVSANCSLGGYVAAPYVRQIALGTKLIVYSDVQMAPITLDDVKNYNKEINKFAMPDSITSIDDAIDYIAKQDGFPKEVVEQAIPRHASIQLQSPLVLTCTIQKQIQAHGIQDISINKGDFSDLLLGLMDQGDLIPDPEF